MYNLYQVNKEDNKAVKAFCILKSRLVQYHECFAKAQGFSGEKESSYTFDDALLDFKDSNLCFLIRVEDMNIGILELETCGTLASIISLYVETPFRAKGIGTSIIQNLKKQYDVLRVRCWYDIPAERLYTTLGAKKRFTEYEL